MVKVYVGNNIKRTPVMVSEDTTLRKVLEDAQVDYSVGMTSLDGSTLKAGDLDKTFKDFGIGETCYLLNTAKAVNAAGIKVLGCTAVVASDFTPADLAEIEKYRPEAMKLKDAETKEVTFQVCQGRGDGSINCNGAEFGEGKTADGKAIITLHIPADKDAKEYIEAKVGVAILNLKKVEAKWERALSEIRAEKAQVLDTIEIM